MVNLMKLMIELTLLTQRSTSQLLKNQLLQEIYTMSRKRLIETEMQLKLLEDRLAPMQKKHRNKKKISNLDKMELLSQKMFRSLSKFLRVSKKLMKLIYLVFVRMSMLLKTMQTKL